MRNKITMGLVIATILTAHISALTFSNQVFAQSVKNTIPNIQNGGDVNNPKIKEQPQVHQLPELALLLKATIVPLCVEGGVDCHHLWNALTGVQTQLGNASAAQRIAIMEGNGHVQLGKELEGPPGHP